LDGLEYHVASGEISRRFEAEPEKYPVENAYYRWLREHATVVWESDVKNASGPHIVVRRLPSAISTHAQRDSVFAAAMPEPTHVNRIELWCLDLSKVFTTIGNQDRAEEWARRGLRVGVKSMEPPLRSALAIALWRKNKLDSAEVQARIAVDLEPRGSTIRMYHGAILTSMARFTEALAEYRKAYELSGGDPRLHVNIAQALSQLGRFEEAVNELLQVPPTHEDRALAVRDAAILMLNHLGRPAEALGYLREAIRLDPNQDQADLVREQIARLEAMLEPRR
jgi:tetratricopeptide (TPR) repeat protein